MTASQYNSFIDRLQALQISTGFASNSVINDPRIAQGDYAHQNAAGTWDQNTQGISVVHNVDTDQTFKYDIA